MPTATALGVATKVPAVGLLAAVCHSYVTPETAVGCKVVKSTVVAGHTLPLLLAVGTGVLGVSRITLEKSFNIPEQPAFPFVALTFKICPPTKVIVLGIAIVKLPPFPFAINVGENDTPLELTIS